MTTRPNKFLNTGAPLPPTSTSPQMNNASSLSSQVDYNDNVIRILPERYVHILDTNLNITRLEVGPQTLVRKEHERLVFGPEQMIVMPPQTYVKIANPISTDKDGSPVLTEFKQVKNRFGDFEYRLARDYRFPFALYPGEIIEGKIENQVVVPQNSAIRLRANREFKDGSVERYAGMEWQIQGPLLYEPRVEVEFVQLVDPSVIKINTALHLRATRNLVDSRGDKRIAGEQWLVRTIGSYLPGVREYVVAIKNGYILSEQNAVHLRASKNFTDVYGHKRVAGQEWLVTRNDAQIHIPDVFEEVVREVEAVSLNSLQYVVLINPYNIQTSKNSWGLKKLIRGETMLFLYPGEKMEDGKIKDVEILGENEALLLQAVENFEESKGKTRSSGERWMIRGPQEYLPPVEVRILERRKAIPLDENEGIYVKDIQTGEVKAVSGQSYMLGANEVLWNKFFPDEIERLLANSRSGIPYIPPKIDERGNLSYAFAPDSNYKRDTTRIVTYKAAHNAAVQIYDYKNKQSRIIFGPDLVKLGPYEEFTVVRLSGGRPKRENIIQSLALSLGPDFMSDEIVVETSDHARLLVKLSYNWCFKVDQNNKEECSKLFNVKDFVGDACKSIASRVRGAVSAISFEDFHHHSSIKIKEAVFGKNKEDGTLRESLTFESNNLVITSVDIQGQEIIDVTTRAFLAESIHIAIQLSTKTTEENAQHQADLLDAENKGQLEKQKLEDDAINEEENIKYLQKQKTNTEISELGIATASAKADAESLEIEGDSLVKRAQLRAQAARVEFQNDLEVVRKSQTRELELERKQVEFEISKAQSMAQIEQEQFVKIINAIGKDTIVQIANAGPETQAQLLKGLGIKGFLVTDGKNPINLFNTANGFMGQNF